MMREIPQAFMGMVAYNQWMIYKVVPSQSRPGKLDKFPCDFRTGQVVNAHDPQYWTTAQQAVASAINFNCGVAFVFTDNDPFFFIDLDNVLRGAVWSDECLEICAKFPGCAMERSVSGTGIHIFGVGTPPPHGAESALGVGGLYHNKRFVALTGDGVIGDCMTDGSANFQWAVNKYWPPGVSASSDWTDCPRQDWRGPVDDEELIRRAMMSNSASNAFGNRASFADLWTNNIEKLSAAYPDEGRGYNSSQADAALAQHLAFWTGNDCERILRLMQKSQIVRDKWQREDYMAATISKAVGMQEVVLTDKEPEPVYNEGKFRIVKGNTYLRAEEQIQLFDGCVYINDQHRVWTKDGQILKPEQFKVRFGGYTFMMDNENTKTTRDAWDAFTQSTTYRCPKVDTTHFMPTLSMGEISFIDGRSVINVYVDIEIKRQVGDASLFIDHMAKLIPDENDRLILMSYMAACVQHKGEKFKWAPLIQGVEGNGKTILTECVAEAVGRRYTHMPPSAEISEKFNGWLFGNILIGVEDVYVPEARREIFEILKPMITSEYLAQRKMNTDAVMHNVVANFIFNSNHKNGMIKTENDRRIAPFFCAQQSWDDLQRDGLNEQYFSKLNNWLRNGGFAIVAELLHTFPIPDALNPAKGCRVAPITTSTRNAVKASLGAVEQEILEAIAVEKPGFCGGFISSKMLDDLLENMGVARRISRLKRHEMLKSMGYDYHPALTEGRVNNVVMPDGTKPRLFIHKSSIHMGLRSGAEVANIYQQLNGLGVFR